MRARITQRLAAGLKPPESGEVVVWDATLPGFGLRVKASGARSFLVNYRRGGRLRRLTIGRYGVLTVTEGRAQARKLLAEVAQGGDPAEEKREAREAETMASLCTRYLEQWAETHKKPSSVRADESNLRLHILPALGRLRVADVTRADVTRLSHSMRGTPGAANRTLAVLGKMMNLAEVWGLRPDGSNPCRHVQKYPERKRERFLSGEELGQLGEALSKCERERIVPPETVALVRLLALTGCRLGELTHLRWENVDLAARVLHLEDSKTGRKTVTLHAAAVQLLDALPHRAEWVLPGSRSGQPIRNPFQQWDRIRKLAKLDGLRLHDLRHSFASVAVGAGVSLYVTGRLLGHTQAATTSRYAHLGDDPVHEAAEKIGARISAGLEGKPDAKVIELRPRPSA